MLTNSLSYLTLPLQNHILTHQLPTRTSPSLTEITKDQGLTLRDYLTEIQYIHLMLSGFFIFIHLTNSMHLHI